MIVVVATTIRDQRASVWVPAISGGVVLLYGGTMPDAGAAVTDQTLLASIDLPDPAGSVTSGVFELSTPLEGMVIADGTPTWARVVDVTVEWVMDLDAGVVGSGAALILSTPALYAGGLARLDRLRLIEP